MSYAGIGRRFDFIVVGAGVIGAAMARCLIARGLSEPSRIALVGERLATTDPGADWALRVFALNRASQRLLEACGIWQRLPAAKISPYERMVVWDESGEAQGRGSLTFDSAELGEPDLGCIVDGQVLQIQCVQAAAVGGATLIEAGVAAVAVDDQECRVRLTDGRDLSAHMIIAADGTDSTTRGLLGIDTAGHAYHQDALVAHVTTERPHRRTAWQRFLSQGPLAFLPLSDGRASIVWSVERVEAQRLRALDARGFEEALNRASDEVLGRCRLTTPVSSFPLKLQYALNYVRPRAVLIGDAAHVVHPLAGQGLNLGLLDCASLADVLSGDDPHRTEVKSLRRYERRRRSENLITAAALDGLERLFSNRNPAVAGLRASGLEALGQWSFAKNTLARRALGLAADMPPFLRQRS